MRFLKYVFVFLVALALAACGGGGGNASGPTGSASSPSPGTDLSADTKVKDILLSLNKTIVQNTGSDSVTLTVTALDLNNNAVVGAAVNVVSDVGSVTVKNANLTDTTGKITATISTGTDKSNRQINLSATVNGITKKTSFQVVGSKLQLTTSASTFVANAPIALGISLKDSANIGISGTKLTISGDVTSIVGTVLNTVFDGSTSSLVFNAPTLAGTYNIIVSGSGVQTTAQITVSSSSSIPNATTLVVPSLAISPSVLATNIQGSSANQAALRTLFVDSNSVPIPNVRVRYFIASTGLGSTDSSLLTNNDIVYSGSNGAAISAFISGQTGSPNNGVQIKACYDMADFAASACPNSIIGNLTISAQAVSVSIGDDILLAKDTGVYIQTLVVTVVNSSGQAVPNADVSFSVDISHYLKGAYSANALALDVSNSLSANFINVSIPDLTTAPLIYGSRIFCPNEDMNRNGIVDGGENINNSKDSFGNPTLDPRVADISIAPATSGVTKTDSFGKLLLKVTYLQAVATWEVYRIRITTNVSGSQGLAERSFITNFNVGDDTNGAPFKTPPYGTGSCSSAN